MVCRGPAPRTGRRLPALLGYLLFLVSSFSFAEETVVGSAPLRGFEAFAQEPALSDAKVSPDGRHIAVRQRLAKDGEEVIFVYDSSDLSQEPIALSASKMQVRTIQWANNEFLLVRFSQDVATLQRLSGTTRLASKLASVSIKTTKWLELPRNRSDRRSDFAKTVKNFTSGQVLDLLEKDEKHVLMRYDDDQNGVADIFRVNVETGASRRIARNSSRLDITYVDEDGEPRLAVSFDEGADALIYLAREKGKRDWFEIGRTVADVNATSKAYASFFVADPAEPNLIYVLSNHETDTAAIYLFDISERKFGEMQFMHPRYDATGLRRITDSNSNKRVVGFTYTGKGQDVYFIDPDEKALNDAIDQILPDTNNFIASRSRDGKTLTIRAEGPKNPLAFYLLRDGRLELLGKSMPYLTEDMLSDVEWVQYKARDGLNIPALVTVPAGEGPYPVVVNPHGGPVARDFWGFDLWAQMLAHHGYLVVQPQFRISSGFGRKHLEAGFGQWGHAMQDDLDDAVDYLVKRGLADPKRAAIFGWSYGGYAAMVGSFRDPNPYRCAIAGAGVSDIPYFRARLGDGGSFSDKAYRPTFEGLNPLDYANSVDVPILLIHGDIDERVPVSESRKFVRKLKQANKFHEYIELQGANHFLGTIYYRHWMKMFPAMVDWLDNTCALQPGRNAESLSAAGP